MQDIYIYTLSKAICASMSNNQKFLLRLVQQGKVEILCLYLHTLIYLNPGKAGIAVNFQKKKKIKIILANNRKKNRIAIYVKIDLSEEFK